jgi:pilus assembly protein CpaE
MHDVLTRCLAIPSDRVRIVVNRYRKNGAVELGDIRQALHNKEPLCIPNDFGAVTESVDMGVPIYESARRSATTKALMRLEQELGGRSGTAEKGFLPRILRTG